jgi:hypothetical protein
MSGNAHRNIYLQRKILSKNTNYGLGTLQMARAIYDFGVDGGAISTITPKHNAWLPDNAIIVAGVINSTTAVTSAGAPSITIGTSAGSSVSAILGAKVKGDYTLDAIIAAVPTFAVPVKLSNKGQITITTDVALTAGVIEVTLFYFAERN